MPTFTAVAALDRFLESKSADRFGLYSKPPLFPNSKLRRRNSCTSATEWKVDRPQISPALYATPEATPLPDSPFFFPPSPYIVNHKRRGPSLSRTSSEVISQRRTLEEDEFTKAKLAESKSLDISKGSSVAFGVHKPNKEKHQNHIDKSPVNVEKANVHGGSIQDEHRNGAHDVKFGSRNGEVRSCLMSDVSAIDGAPAKVGPMNLDRSGENEDLFDPNETSSASNNTEGDDHTVAETAARSGTSGVEFYDAWDELCPESAPQPAVRNIEAELCEIRSSLHVEIEKRKQAEEALNKIKCKWQTMRQELAVVGLSLPADLFVVTDDELAKPVEELRQQETVTRLVSLSVGRGIARAEMGMEMESQIESKNFEMARVLDRLHYYEAVNREMSQRNQEAIEMARRDRQRKKRRQRWVWGSIVTAITLGMVTLAWSYLPEGKGLLISPTSIPQTPGTDDAAVAKWHEKFTDVEEVIPVSAKHGHGVDDIKDWILSKLSTGPPYFPKDIVSEHPERFFVAEIIREKIFMQYRIEVPYACQGGKALKILGTTARLDVEDFLQKEVFLEV
ncbi:hypothetical protein V6N13_133103 [Hibiscus sabdariffa]|uniref:Uncharacterized protein n=1 Tax=Hibiscus sabdariffa TaxID=183260 RepID=A0ABR2PX98_9ROSI